MNKMTKVFDDLCRWGLIGAGFLTCGMVGFTIGRYSEEMIWLSSKEICKVEEENPDYFIEVCYGKIVLYKTRTDKNTGIEVESD